MCFKHCLKHVLNKPCLFSANSVTNKAIAKEAKGFTTIAAMVCFLVKSLFIDSVVKNHGSQIRAKQKVSGRLKKYFRPKFADVPILLNFIFFQDRRKYRVAMPAERLPIHFRFMLLSLSIFVFTVISVPMM